MEDRPGSELPMNVVVNTEDSAVSFLVDEIGDVLEVEEEHFEPTPDTLQGRTRELVGGVYKLRDKLMLVLDIERAVSGDESAVRS